MVQARPMDTHEPPPTSLVDDDAPQHSDARDGAPVSNDNDLEDIDDDVAARGIDDDSGYGPDSYFAHAMSKDD